MKVKHLIEILSKFDPELDIGVLHDNGIDLATEAGIYEGDIHVQYGNKMITKRVKEKYVLLGNPGDYDQPAYHDNNKPIEVYEQFQDGEIMRIE